MNMKAKLYIDSEKSIIKVEGDPSEALHLLVCAIAQTLEGLFPHDFEKQMAFGAALLYRTVRELNKGNEENDDED